jgi:hypothetical protein
MALFDHTAKRLARGPTLALAAERSEEVTGLLHRYDPAVQALGDRFAFGNGVLLYGPIQVTPKLAAQAGLPEGTVTAYFGSIRAEANRNYRPEDRTRRDAQRLIRGLAVRLGGTVHGSRTSEVINLLVAVYAPRPAPPEQVISVLQPYASGTLFVKDNPNVPESYSLLTEESPRFWARYWPPDLARNPIEPPAPAIGALRDQEPCRWDLCKGDPTDPVDEVSADLCLDVGRAAFDLARQASGVVIDFYGFPVDQPEDLLPPAESARGGSDH